MSAYSLMTVCGKDKMELDKGVIAHTHRKFLMRKFAKGKLLFTFVVK